jgi:protein gp37
MTIQETPHLDWLLLTKRPENWRLLLERSYGAGGLFPARTDAWLRGMVPPNVWVGTSVENQQRADERILHLLRIPARVRFLSCEPLLGPVELGLIGTVPKDIAPRYTLVYQMLHWIIVGGESGPQARPMHPQWARSLRDQCQQYGVPFFFKQWGEWVPFPELQGSAPFVPGAMTWPWSVRLPDGDLAGDTTCMVRIGKRAAPRTLGGRLWEEFPRVEVAQ